MIHSIKIVFVFAFIFILYVNKGNSQTKLTLQFSFVYGSNAFVINDSINELDSTTHLQLTELKFYISNITFLKNKKAVFVEKNSFHLIDASKLASQKIEIKTPKLIQADEVVFYLGIDSATNVSGALGGDLDPTKGMYWTWQSGYINFKIEGKSALCKTRNNEFQFHLGGYTQPNNCLKTISLPIKDSKNINMQVDVKKIVEQFNLSQLNKIMSPSQEAVMLSEKITTCFNLIEL